VFVEVKSRHSGRDAAPDREISPDKRRKVALASREFRRNTHWEKARVRFDVVTVVFSPRVEVRHFANAWSENEALAARA
jgi:Holliday junction resolvase-like predicted endonuclease